jgi:hypothetical protein
MMLSKLEQFVGSSAQAGARSASANGSTKGGSETSSRSQTPPLGGKADNAKIKISQPEVDFGDGQRPKIVALSFMDDQKRKDASKVANLGGTAAAGGQNRAVNSVDTLYQLFLNILLRPREWTAQFDGNGYFAFRREHIIALAEECQKILEE